MLVLALTTFLASGISSVCLLRVRNIVLALINMLKRQKTCKTTSLSCEYRYRHSRWLRERIVSWRLYRYSHINTGSGFAFYGSITFGRYQASIWSGNVDISGMEDVLRNFWLPSD